MELPWFRSLCEARDLLAAAAISASSATPAAVPATLASTPTTLCSTLPALRRCSAHLRRCADLRVGVVQPVASTPPLPGSIGIGVGRQRCTRLRLWIQARGRP
jgi:hypothetical protein